MASNDAWVVTSEGVHIGELYHDVLAYQMICLNQKIFGATLLFAEEIFYVTFLFCKVLATWEKYDYWGGEESFSEKIYYILLEYYVALLTIKGDVLILSKKRNCFKTKKQLKVLSKK